MKRRIFIGRLRDLLIAMAILMLTILQTAGFASAQETGSEAAKAFPELITDLKEQGLLPEGEGHFVSLGDYEEAYANMSYYLGVPLLEADQFVIRTSVAWTSANMTPNSAVSGCGVFFNTGADKSEHLLASLRMDGYFYLSGIRGYTNLSYGKIPFARASREGEAELTLVAKGEQVTVFVDGNQILHREGIADTGSEVGLAVLSGTNLDFGTRCTFRDIRMYIWKDELGSEEG